MHEQPVAPVHVAGDDRAPPVVVGELHDLAAKPLDRSQLCLGRVVGNGDDRVQRELAPDPGHALSHVAGAGGEQAAGAPLLRRAHDRVRGATNLERVDRLERLQLEVDLGRGLLHVQADQRRAHRRAGDPLPRRLDLRQLDH
jgi:hypothetical protein